MDEGIDPRGPPPTIAAIGQSGFFAFFDWSFLAASC